MRRAACLALALGLGALSVAQTRMEDVVRRFSADRESILRYYNLPFSELGTARVRSFLDETRQRLDALDFAKLDRDGQIDWLLLDSFVEAERRDQGTRKTLDSETLKILPFAPLIVALEEDRWSLKPLDPKKAAETIEKIRDTAAKAHTETKAAFDKKELSASQALRASRALNRLRESFKRWYDHYNGYKPLFSWWCEKPYELASKELTEDERILKEEYAGQRGKDDDPLVGDPIGKERLDNDLKREMLGVTPEGLIKIAEGEYAWCEAEMVKASQALGFGKDWKKALEKVKDDHVAPGEQDDLIMAQGIEAVKFIEDRDLVTVEPLCKETWHVNMLSAEQQKNWPFAFYGGQNMSTSYPLPEMTHSTKMMSMRGNNKHFLRAVTHHELIPGHHLQAYMAQRHREYRGVFSSPFFIEGWALHWEMLLWDLDFAQSPENKIGMLFWRMHRCARIVVSLKFHLGEMSPEKMIDYLVEKVGHERWTATSEVRRYVGDMYSPLYQCAYMIGGLQLRAIYRDMVPKQLSPKAFHDAVLKLGPIPMPMVRASLDKQKLGKGSAIDPAIRPSFED